MKLVFLGTSGSILYYMRFHRAVRATYDREQDTFRVAFLLAPCAALALLVNQERSPLEVTPLAGCPVRHAGAGQHSRHCRQAPPMRWRYVGRSKKAASDRERAPVIVKSSRDRNIIQLRRKYWKATQIVFT